MNHPSHDELLELALGASEGNQAIDEHARSCLECSARLGDVRQEQEILRTAFHLTPASETLRRELGIRPAWPRWAAAAAGLLIVAGLAVAAGWGTGGHRTDARHSPIALERMQRKLQAVVQKLEDTRESLVQPLDEQKSQAYVQLLSEEEILYASALEGSLDQVSPVSPTQSAQLHELIHQVSGRAWQHPDPSALAAAFKSRLRTILNETQYRTFEEYSVAEREWDRENDIDHFTVDLARQFDLRYSEAKRVRDILEAQYPSEDLPMVCLTLDVSDRLFENPPLTLAIRNALDPEHRDDLDAFLKNLRKARETADQIARQNSLHR